MTSRPGLRLQQHWLFALVLVAGVVLRVVVMVGYRPALLFPDAFRYLIEARSFYFSGARPGGYSLLLWPVVHLTHSLLPITLTQHVIGLALASASYVFLLRRGLPPWGAAFAVVPVLLDPLQLVLEHYVLSDVLFETLLVTACLVLLWNHRPGYRAMVAAGALVGCSVLTRGAGSFLLAAFVVALLCLRVSWRRLVVFLVAALLPISVYVVGYHQAKGEYAVVSSGPRFLYARLAPFLPCDRADFPSYEKNLCPPRPVGQRHDTGYFMWGRGRGPAYHVHPPAGMTVAQVIKDFDKRMIRAEPQAYARIVAADVARGFSLSRKVEVPSYPAAYWQFADHNWSLDLFARWKTKYHDEYPLSASPGAARFMTSYGKHLHTPGPLLAALLLVAAAATAGLGRARWSGVRIAVGLIAGCCALTVLTGAAFSGFSWRYQLPQIPLAPVAGALALAALFRGPAPGAPAPAPVTMLDRATARVLALPMPRGWRLRAQQSPRPLRVALAVLVGLVVGCVVTALGVGSGWAVASTAAVLGVVAGVLVAGVLLLSRAPATDEPASSAPGAPRPPATA